mmetsp:Transcript_4925/g.6872  ORF Transcript_4925/g.6872 Transcript_4925/m.6872 type:complete len:102 (+) Transcript_4925:1060-1365(+)
MRIENEGQENTTNRLSSIGLVYAVGIDFLFRKARKAGPHTNVGAAFAFVTSTQTLPQNNLTSIPRPNVLKGTLTCSARLTVPHCSQKKRKGSGGSMRLLFI